MKKVKKVPKTDITLYKDEKIKVRLVLFNYVLTPKGKPNTYYPTVDQLFKGILKLKLSQEFKHGAFDNIKQFKSALDGALGEVRHIASKFEDSRIVTHGKL